MSDLVRRLDFRTMAISFWFRDILSPPKDILGEAEIKPGDVILDFGCGPGSFSLVAAELVGENGKVFALDKNPLALEEVKKKVRKKGIKNIDTIRANLETGLMYESVDVILFYDTYHDVSDKEGVLKELHRVLKPEGILSFSDHHLKEEEILAAFNGFGLFELQAGGKKTYSFKKTVKIAE